MGYLDQFYGYEDTMLSEFWGYLPCLFYGYGIFFKLIKGIWNTGTPPPPFQDLTKEGNLSLHKAAVLLEVAVDWQKCNILAVH